MKKQRTAEVSRITKETAVRVTLNLDRFTEPSVKTTVPFFDHMLALMAQHARFGLTVAAKGDTDVDCHHLIEDVGITFGQALKKALGDKKGIVRYGNFLLPMDEALSYVALDLSGRPYLEYAVKFSDRFKGFDFDLLEHFFAALTVHAGLTLHVSLRRGRDNHHIAESMFKGFGRALGAAIGRDPRSKGVPSTKGIL